MADARARLFQPGVPAALADGELRAAESRRLFTIHAILYAVVNIVLVISNLLLTPASPWAVIPAVLWGIALLIHYFVAFRWMQSENEQWMAKVEYLAEELHRANEMPMRRAASLGTGCGSDSRPERELPSQVFLEPKVELSVRKEKQRQRW